MIPSEYFWLSIFQAHDSIALSGFDWDHVTKYDKWVLGGSDVCDFATCLMADKGLPEHYSFCQGD